MFSSAVGGKHGISPGALVQRNRKSRSSRTARPPAARSAKPQIAQFARVANRKPRPARPTHPPGPPAHANSRPHDFIISHDLFSPQVSKDCPSAAKTDVFTGQEMYFSYNTCALSPQCYGDVHEDACPYDVRDNGAMTAMKCAKHYSRRRARTARKCCATVGTG